MPTLVNKASSRVEPPSGCCLGMLSLSSFSLTTFLSWPTVEPHRICCCQSLPAPANRSQSTGANFAQRASTPPGRSLHQFNLGLGARRSGFISFGHDMRPSQNFLLNFPILVVDSSSTRTCTWPASISCCAPSAAHTARGPTPSIQTFAGTGKFTRPSQCQSLLLSPPRRR